ncbi:M50 family metallopeptidase [Cellulomonas sp. ES6]|uniref:M50 family metallopeptidase n=1 Tax=Cellulomonas sp. ES6 TaxID=3039384 RepID=UPI0024B79693|nr:M50 family metallopeptidase [Cellulomonas sp. ES6]WHP16062.1 M50 family metallopeptidase [Cellulomonas sp. ES6]
MTAVLDDLGGLPGEIWDRATTVQPAPGLPVLLGTLGVALLCLAVPTLWHLSRHLLTIVHEAAHALVAVLFGRRLSGMRVHSDTSGLTVSVGRPRGPGMVATAFAGYVGPAVLGLAASWVLGRGYAVGLLWGLVVALALVLVQIRNWYGLWAVLVTGVALVGVTWWGTPAVQVAVAYAVTWFLLLGAPRAVLEMQAQRRRGRGRGTSDADALARLTPLPGGFWVGAFLVVCVGALVLGGSWILQRPLL